MSWHSNADSITMDIERFREYCLSFEGVTEKTPFGKFAARFDSILVFYVCGHMFCMIDMDSFDGAVVKGSPERIGELLETRASCCSHRNMSQKYWIELKWGGDITENEILSMVKQSYDIVKAKYAKQK